LAFRSTSAAALIAVALALSTAHTAHATPSAGDRETARSLVEEGKQKRDKNDLQGALEAFRAADAIMHVPTTGMLVARTQVQLGLLVDARDTAVRVARLVPAPDDPPPFTQARKEAEQLADELAPRIPTLKVTLQGVQADGTRARVTIDEAPVAVAALVAPRKMNPGHHVVVAKLGGQDRQQEVDLAERDAKEVTLDLTGLEAVAEGGEEGGQPGGAGAGGVEPPGEKERTKTSPLVYAGFGVGAVGLVVGSVAGILTLSKKDTASQKCQDFKCPPAAYDDLDAANGMATISTVGFVVAGIGATVGVIGLIVGGGKAAPKSPAASAASVTPWIGPGSAGLRGAF